MGRTKRALSAAEVRGLCLPGYHAVGGATGLYLSISKSGAKSWILRATVSGKRRDIGLGPFLDVTLAQARERARAARDQIWNGVDPVAQRKAAKAALAAEIAKHITFREAAQRCHQLKAPEFRNDKHSKQWINSLKQHAFPSIGHLLVSEIQMNDVLQMLEKIWYDKTETATRVRQRVESVLSWAAVSGFRSGDNPARWEGNLKEVLPKPSKVKTVEHFKALPWQQIGSFMEKLRARDGISARALEFLIFTGARSGEVRGMTWSEVDMSTATWTIPANRIKAGRQHKVPLSAPALKILKEIQPRPDSQYVFYAKRGGALSDMTLLAVLKRMDVPAVPHGFRSTFKDWARNCTKFPDEVSELALAHVNNDATRAAYARDELLPQRTKLMASWAKYCTQVPSNPDESTVVSIQRSA